MLSPLHCQSKTSWGAATKAVVSVLGLVKAPCVLFVPQGNGYSSLAMNSQKLNYSYI